MPKLFCVVVDVFGEVEHDGDPHIIRSDFYIPMSVVGVEESREESVVVICNYGGFASFLICERVFRFIIVPQVPSI